MNRFLSAACWCGLAAAICAVALQERPPAAEPFVLIESQPIAEREMELPEDGGRWSTIAVYPDGAKDRDSMDLASWLATNPRLQSLRAQTKFFELPQSHWWPVHYGPRTPAPYILVLDEANKPIYHAYAGNLPGDGENLADEIQAQIADCCPDVEQPEPQHQWESKRKIPMLRPTSPAKDESLLLIVLALLGSGGAGLWLRMREQQDA
jgi:hypothetical protein